MSGALLVAGTHSDAGKSVLTAGLCRWLADQGVKVAPFKAQNMSLNSTVTADGAEIGRAQAMQAAAARVAPEAAMNPVLLKPGSDTHSQLVLRGQPVGELDAQGYQDRKASLLPVVLDCLAELRARFEVVICEGAGSPAEINLRAGDITNMGLARAADLPVLVVGDIDRGGVFAALFGTLALLSAADQRQVAGFVINKFRGSAELLEPGLAMLENLTGRRTFGVLPWRGGLWLDGEDSLDLAADRGAAEPAAGDGVLRVSVIALPRLSNFTDIDALAAEPGVLVRYASRPEELADADLVVLPGSRATVRDLGWLRERGLADALLRRAAMGLPLLAICAGYQMCGELIDDPVESGAGQVPGLGLLPVRTVFAPAKTLRLATGTWRGAVVHGYEIHHGITSVHGGQPLLWRDGQPEGCVRGAVTGSSWHGLCENDDWRRDLLASAAAGSGSGYRPALTRFAQVRERRLAALGELVAEHLDADAIWRLLEQGVPAGLPALGPGAAR